jgi:hypothetical protein
MASGINSPLRQVGIATGVAALGAVLASRVRDIVTAHLAGVPHAHAIADAVAGGRAGQTLRGAAPAARARLAHAAEAGFAGALDTILLIGGVTALVAAVATVVLIRSQDFAQHRVAEPAVAAG